MRVDRARSSSSFFFTLGLAMSGRGPWARLRFVALCAGTIVLCLGLSGLAGTMALAQDRAARAESIRPTLTEDVDQGRLLISFDGFTQLDDNTILVQSIWPLVPDAPLPPGVSAWPEPGEAVVSPSVHELLVDSDPEFFGPVAAVIGPDGLETPTERRAYLRPAAEILDPDRMSGATGFGEHGGDGWHGLGMLNAAPTWGVLLLFLSATIIPGGAAVSLGAGLDRQRRLTRHRRFTVAGARRRDTSLVDAGEAFPALILGAGLAALAVGMVATFGLRLPTLDTVVLAGDVRRHLFLMAGVLVLGFSIAMFIVVVVRPRMLRLRGRRRRRVPVMAGEHKSPAARATAGLLIGAATVVLPPLTTSGPLRTITYALGTSLFVLCLPAVLAVILGAAGDGIASIGARAGSVGGLLGGRRLGAFPGRTARLCLGIAGTILVVGQVQLWSAQLGRQYFDSVALREQHGTSLLVAPVGAVTPGVETFVAALDKSTLAMWSWFEEGPGGMPQEVLGASCLTWRALALPCDVTALTTAQLATGPSALALASGGMMTDSGVPARTLSASTPSPPKDADALSLILMSLDGSDLPERQLESSSYRLVQGGLRLQTPWQSWISAGVTTKLAGSWAVAWGMLGVVGMLIATALSLVGDVISSARDVAPLAALSGRWRWLTVLSLWRLGLPITLAAALGAVSYYILPSGLQSGENVMVASPTFVVACVAAGAAIAVLMTVVAGQFLSITARRWRPGDSDYTTV